MEAATASIYNILGGIAIVVGAVWTVWRVLRTRQHFVCANVDVKASSWLVGPSERLVRVVLRIENVGNVKLKVALTEAWIQQVLPVEDRPIDDLRGLPEDLGVGGYVEDPDAAPDAEAPWREVAVRTIRYRRGEFPIEPGETDEDTFDFLVDPKIVLALVYGYLQTTSWRFPWHFVREDGRLAIRVKERLGWSRRRLVTLGRGPDETHQYHRGEEDHNKKA